MTSEAKRIKPIYLFADSQLLFWRPIEAPFISSLRRLIESESPKAAYIGASNGDNPEYHGIFEAAMQSIGITNCPMISSSLSEAEASFVEQADLILLAGGDVETGWNAFERSGLKDLIIRRYLDGALLIGTSAGAVQLGMLGRSETDQDKRLFDTFRLVPFVIGAHDEANEWGTLKSMLRASTTSVSGIGIPSGGGMIYHADQSVEPIRYPVHEFSLKDGQMTETLLYPKTEPPIIEASEVC